MSELKNVSRLHSRISELEKTVKGLQEEHNNMSTSIETLETTDENMFKSIDNKLSKILSTSETTALVHAVPMNRVSSEDAIYEPVAVELKNSCRQRKGWTGSGGSIINFKKDGTNGLERGMTLGDCVRIGKQNGWNFVGHRNSNHGASVHKNTCWRHDSNPEQDEKLEEWIEKDKGNDNVHTTIRLKGSCIF